ncbi:hypothetical protein PR048_030026 [Dryococelus australis]|uniref:Uncharacterized protein n=1 Tax=Dryococelus australis TaxID=614101 RepID=A0ABQ9GAN9_9NEOP|nr:hypothetical protein PR048_030026 [Dryococelus australis]
MDHQMNKEFLRNKRKLYKAVRSSSIPDTIESLHEILQNSETGTDRLKWAILTPLFKKGDNTEVGVSAYERAPPQAAISSSFLDLVRQPPHRGASGTSTLFTSHHQAAKRFPALGWKPPQPRQYPGLWSGKATNGSSTRMWPGVRTSYARGSVENAHIDLEFHTAETWANNVESSSKMVAPFKTLNVPKLELYAVLLLNRLWQHINRLYFDKINEFEVHTRTDSSVVLAWLHLSPYHLKTFVANRVAEIQAIVPPSTWKHVPPEENPADVASQDALPEQLLTHLWWYTG